MIAALTLLLVCQFAGEVLAHAAGIPLPGPVIGMMLLLGLLIWRQGPSEPLRAVSGTLLRALSLLYVPAGVGVVTQLALIGRNWLPIGAALVVSTLLGLAVTGLVMYGPYRNGTIV